MKKILFILIALWIYCLAVFVSGSSNAPSRVAVDGIYEVDLVDSTKNVTLFGSITAGLDTLDGADSLRCLRKWNPSYGWEYILTTNALSGDSAANVVLEVIVDALDKNDSLISHTILDTIAAAGGSVLLPVGQKSGYIGVKFDVWLKAVGASDETVIQKMWMHKRRPIVTNRNFK